jgi:hypothetical protein
MIRPHLRANVWAAALLGATTAVSGRVPEAYEYAFKFASAITSDPKDRAKAQEAVVWDLTSTSQWDSAERAADQIEGWRRGTACADLATALAKSGQKERARALITKAEAFRSTIEGWQNPRIAAHIANAWAALGDTARSESIAAAVATEDPIQYAGRKAATVASGLAANGRFEEAEKELTTLSGAKDIDDTWWRTVGYLEMSRQPGLTKEQRTRALAEARRSAAGIPTWKKAEALESVADEYRKHGVLPEARAIVAEAEVILVALPDTMPIKAPLLSNCARAWAELGRKDKARNLISQVESLAPVVQDIERPVVYANAARSAVAMGDTGTARRLYGRALTEAGLLANARPRALAVVEICRSIGNSGLELDTTTRSRLDTLFMGLKDPW